MTATTATLAFDVYGTLIDTHGVVAELQALVGERAQAFSQTWRDKQLEYAFRRGLMRQYAEFSICTRDALEYSCQAYQVNFSEEQKQTLLSCYQTLPAFADVSAGLASLQQAGHRLYAFSNGTRDAVEKLLQAAAIRTYFIDIVSVDEIQTFKPNPDVYQHFLERSDAVAENTWLVSSNPFDVIGAQAAGLQGAWVRRSELAVFDPWGSAPSATVTDIPQLLTVLAL